MPAAVDGVTASLDPGGYAFSTGGRAPAAAAPDTAVERVRVRPHGELT